MTAVKWLYRVWGMTMPPMIRGSPFKVLFELVLIIFFFIEFGVR